jgi:hypothetical protein
MRNFLLLLALAGVAADALSQQIYKYVASNGAVVYTDSPAALANGGQRLEVAPASSPPVRDAAIAADGELRLARLRRIGGVTPLAHERDGAHLKPTYWQRQRELTHALVQARTKVAQARTMAEQP